MKTKSSLLFCTLLLGLTGCGGSTGENQLVAISINTEPTKKEYTEGEFLDPEGLIINAIRTNDTIQVAYDGNEDKFTFEPSLDTELTLDDNIVTITYEEKIAFLTITINQAIDSFTADFTVKHTKAEDIPTQGNSDTQDMKSILNSYYFNESAAQIRESSGGFYQINEGFNITKTRSYPQVMTLGSKKQNVDLTLQFTTSIIDITFVCEPYSKYIAYSDTQNVDYATYLEVNGVKKEIDPHTASDVDETQTLKFTVNDDTVTIKCPNTNTGGSDTQANRILVYKITITFAQL